MRARDDHRVDQEAGSGNHGAPRVDRGLHGGDIAGHGAKRFSAQCHRHADFQQSDVGGFCGGVDIKEMQAHPERISQLNRNNYLTFKAIRDCAVPVVSALHGFVIGGGVGIAGASDALIAAEGAYISLPEIDRGAMGGAAFMARMVSQQKMRAKFFTGAKIPIEDLHQHGSVEKIVPLDQLEVEARAFCEIVASKSRAALVIAKQALNLIEPVNPSEQYRVEQGFTLEMYMHEDSQKARDAFVHDKGAAAKF